MASFAEALSPVPTKMLEQGHNGRINGEPISPKEKRSPSGKRSSVQLSTSFMDALGSSVSEPAKKKVRKASSSTTKKSKEPKKSKKNDVLDSIYDTMDRATVVASSRSPSPPQGKMTPPLQQEEAVQITTPRRSRQRISFADDMGGALVHIRYFEVEEGERVNVNRLTPEEMRHLDSQMEKKCRREHNASSSSPGGTSPADADWMPDLKKRSTWHLIPVAHTPTRTYGSKSKEHAIEEQRQRTALEALYMGMASDRIDEPDHKDTVSTHNFRVKEIPLEPAPPVARAPSPTYVSPVYTEDTVLQSPSISATVAETPATSSGLEPSGSVFTNVTTTPTPVAPTPATPSVSTLPANLLNLLAGLKKTGIMSDDSCPSPTVPRPSLPIHTVPQTAAPTVVGVANPMVQPTYSQEFHMPPTSYQATPAHQYSQVNLPPTSSPSNSSASSLRILTNVDPHSIVHNQDGITYNMKHGHAGGVATSTSAPPMNHTYNGPPRPFGGVPRQCRQFAQPSGCPYGNRCKFAHGDQAPAPREPYRGGFRGRGNFSRAPYERRVDDGDRSRVYTQQ